MVYNQFIIPGQQPTAKCQSVKKYRTKYGLLLQKVNLGQLNISCFFMQFRLFFKPDNQRDLRLFKCEFKLNLSSPVRLRNNCEETPGFC